MHVLQVCQAEAQHQAQGVMVGREGVSKLILREGEERQEFNGLYDRRHSGGAGLRSYDIGRHCVHWHVSQH